MIRDRIVFGTNSSKVREKLINEGAELTLDKAVQIAQNMEYSKQQLSSMASAADKDVHQVARPRKRLVRRREKPQDSDGKVTCSRCGTTHQEGKTCPAKGKTCRKCGKLNHFQKMCKSRNTVNRTYRVTIRISMYARYMQFTFKTKSYTCNLSTQACTCSFTGPFKNELKSMEDKGIIQKVTRPTDWVNSLVCVEKPSTGKLRVCLDPEALNDNIMRPHYPMRTIEDVTNQLTGAKYFSVLDATKAYWSIKLTDESSYLTTFNSPFGIYRYLRLPMGIKSSQDIFCQKIDEFFEDVTGVMSIVDDLLVYGRTIEEHDANLTRVLDRAREKGIRFNPDKCVIGSQEVKYFGHDTYQELSDGLDVHVYTVINSLPVSDGKLQGLRLSTQQDSQFQTLKQTIIDDWPESRHECPNSILEFWNHRDELSTVNDIIFRRQTLVIPSSLRTEMIYAVHVGVTKTLNRAKDIMFWPGMVKQVTDHVLACPLCLTHRASNVKEPLNPHIVPQKPWQHIAADLFTLDGRDYLITAEVYSNYFEVDALPETKSKTVIRKLTMHMARYGQLETLKSDNGPQFSSEEFQKFASDWNFKHVTSTPGYSQSNGFIEKMVSIAKKTMKKCQATKTDPYLAFLEYRNTPLNCGYSPAQLLMGRRLKSILPSTNEQLKPSFINQKSVRKSLQENKVTQKNYYDKSSRSLPPLNKDDSCRVQFGKTWKPAIVLKKEGERSYKVQTEDGAIYRRNRRFINKTREKFPINTESFTNILHQGQDPNK
ncbi:uncharacterized protein K02A2.6-like [Ruditapes philippinarum]|uniref:uncharacterized protein K02A2.6-like n=1 Tax=Ruditapes philippinarum TaxID=129788 RepID=UPI00295B2F4D|nr:uncharacterized protein K02A2.6-like [Ruditapes philippinarum]